MSIWGFIAFQTMTAVLGTEHCQMLGMDLKVAQIVAVAMSSDGNCTLSKVPTAPRATTTTVFIGRAEQYRTWSVAAPAPVDWEFIDDSARIYGNSGWVIANQPNFKMSASRGLMFQDGQLLAIPDSGEWKGSFRILGVGKDELFGGTIEQSRDSDLPMSLFGALVWQRGASKKLFESDMFTHAINWCGSGVLGMAGSKRTTAPIAVIFEGGGATPLPLPRGMRFVEPTACSRDGSVIVGMGHPGSSPNGACVVWVNRVPRTVSIGRGQSSDARLVAVAELGEMAVGSIGTGTNTVACAWEAEKGLRSVYEIARDRKIVLPFGWRLLTAVGVGPQGEKIFGTAIDWKGRQRPYLLKFSKEGSK